MLRIYNKETGLFLRDDFNFDETTEAAYIGDIPSGFYWPKYDGTKWVEVLTQAEIDALKLRKKNEKNNKKLLVDELEKQTTVKGVINVLVKYFK